MRSLSVLLSLFTLIILSCSSSKSTATQNEIEALKQLVDSKSFYIESDWAYPQMTAAMSQVLNSPLMRPGDGAGGISLIGNSNFLKIEGDSISSFLPYYGERRMNVSYGGTDNSIEFNGVMKDYQVKKNKHNGYNINFEARSNNESYDVTIFLFPNLKSAISIIGYARTPIRYTGNVNVIKRE